MSARRAFVFGSLPSLAVAIIFLTGGASVQAQDDVGPGIVKAPIPDGSAAQSLVAGSDAPQVDELEEPGSSTDSGDGLRLSTGVKSATQKVVKDPALKLTDPRTYRLKVVVRVEANDGRLTNVVAVAPIPMDWPEQQVRLISQRLSPSAKVSQQVLPGQAAILKLQAASVPKGGSVTVERLYEITRHRMQFSLPGDEMEHPHRPPAELRDQLTGPAPGLEVQHPKIVSLTEKLRQESAGGNAWDTVKNFWQWIRANVDFQNGDFRGALFAVEQHCGDCEEMSALFVSMCRLSNITARTVWVEGHDYPEFYLSDKQGAGHWIPAQVVGPAWFGEMAEYRPIFQKGDRFFDPFQKQYTRYVPHTARAEGSSSEPKLIVDHQIIADSDINGPSYNSTK